MDEMHNSHLEGNECIMTSLPTVILGFRGKPNQSWGEHFKLVTLVEDLNDDHEDIVNVLLVCKQSFFVSSISY